MSADNWAACPKCTKAANGTYDRMQAALKEKYGTIPAEEYLRMAAEFENTSPEAIRGENSLREDYEFYMNEDGEFIAVYHGHCSECNFDFKFEHKETVKI